MTAKAPAAKNARHRLAGKASGDELFTCSNWNQPVLRSADEQMGPTSSAAVIKMRASRAGDSIPASKARRFGQTSAMVRIRRSLQIWSGIRFGKQIGLMICYESIDKFVQGAAVQDLVELVQSQIDAVIRDTSLWKIVRANFCERSPEPTSARRCAACSSAAERCCSVHSRDQHPHG